MSDGMVWEGAASRPLWRCWLCGCVGAVPGGRGQSDSGGTPPLGLPGLLPMQEDSRWLHLEGF